MEKGEWNWRLMAAIAALLVLVTALASCFSAVQDRNSGRWMAVALDERGHLAAAWPVSRHGKRWMETREGMRLMLRVLPPCYEELDADGCLGLETMGGP